MLPEVKAAFSLSEVGVGAITTTRELASGTVTLPGGVVADVVRRHWGIILALCMGGFGAGWLLIGAFPSYWILLLGIVVTSVAASIWHLPAMAALSHHFSHRRGTALSFHGIGGNIGDCLAPIVTGMLLGILSWRGILSIYAVVPLLLMFVVYWAFRDIGHTEDANTPKTTFRGQLALARELIKNRALLGITLVEGLRGMAFLAVITFLPLYLDEIALLTPAERGWHFGLVMVMGIPATPAMGYISDIIGRKLVLVPALLALAGVMLLLVGFGTGPLLIVILILMGLF
jgi:MFS family permease